MKFDIFGNCIDKTFITEDGYRIKFGTEVWWITDISGARWTNKKYKSKFSDKKETQLKPNYHTKIWRFYHPELGMDKGKIIGLHVDKKGVMSGYYKVFRYRKNAELFILNQFILNMKQKINIADYYAAKENGKNEIIEITTGLIQEVEFLPKNKKMIKMTVKFSDTDIRPVISNIGGKLADISILKGKEMPFVTNLEPAVVSKHDSLAMIVVEEKDGELIIP
jgi:tRNA-binding EMAP/Myf-like protein